MAITNTLINRIQEIKIEGESFKDANYHKNKKDEIEQVFLPAFKDMINKFSEVIEAYNNLIVISDIKDVSIEKDLIIESISIIKEKVIIDGYDKASVLNLKKILNANYSILMDLWTKFISDKTSAISEMLSTLDKLIANMPEKSTLQLKKNRIISAKIGEISAIDAINAYINTYNELMTKLNLKDNILVFLKKLTSEQNVSVADMDEEVYNWVRKSEFVNRIKLKIG